MHLTCQQSFVFTCWKQLRTLGSILLPPNAATSPSCRGIWMASWSSRPSCLWSHISVGPATSPKRSTRGTGKRLTSSAYAVLLVMWIEWCRFEKCVGTWNSLVVSWFLTILIFWVSSQDLVSHVFLKTINCCVSLHTQTNKYKFPF